MAIRLLRRGSTPRLSFHFSNIQNGRRILFATRGKNASIESASSFASNWSSYSTFASPSSNPTPDPLAFLSSDERILLKHLIQPDTHISPFWLHQLSKMTNSRAIDLISKLTPTNSIGYEKPKSWATSPQSSPSSSPSSSPGSVGSVDKPTRMMQQVIDWKNKYSNMIILVRKGEFYETWGVDALMLINYCGLNPMGGKAEAGCPVDNVQQTLDDLTENGFFVAIFEESSDTDVNRGPAPRVQSKLKERYLSQIVSPGSRTYLCSRHLSLRADDIAFNENRPFIGILNTQAGYVLAEIHIDRKCVVISERLNDEALRAIIDQTGFSEPIYFQGTGGVIEYLNTFNVETLHGIPEKSFVEQVRRRVCQQLELDAGDFRIITRSYSNRPRPIYKSTSTQIGLDDKNDKMPSLVPSLLPKDSQAHSARFMKRWLLNPPTHKVADHMRSLCSKLSSFEYGLPICRPASLGKVITLLSARECNVAMFRQIEANMKTMLTFLMCLPANQGDDPEFEHLIKSFDSQKKVAYSHLAEDILPIVTYECGKSVEIIDLINGCQYILKRMEAIVPSIDTVDECNFDPNPNQGIPYSFFQENEETFRGRIVSNHPKIAAIYSEVNTAAKNLMTAVADDFPLGCRIRYDKENQFLFFDPPTNKASRKKNTKEKEIEKEENNGINNNNNNNSNSNHDVANNDNSNNNNNNNAEAQVKTASKSTSMDSATASGGPSSKEFYHPKIKGVEIKGLSTKLVQKCTDEYLTLTTQAPKEVEKLLGELSQDLAQHLLIIEQALHWAIVMQAAHQHTKSAKQKGWVLPTLQGYSDDDAANGNHNVPPPPALKLKGMTPYWIERWRAIKNDLTLSGIFLLTAPNMSGKSTLMRSVLVTALLANCGFFVPCDEAVVPRYDTFFLRTTSFDVPGENKSAFALEMDDMRVIERDSTHKSLIMIDEIGKGTSSIDGAALAGAFLEDFDARGCSGIFATHLHEVFDLQLNLKRVEYKRMGIDRNPIDNSPAWTYTLEDGMCRDSLALHTAQVFGIPMRIIKRAEELQKVRTASPPVDATVIGHNSSPPSLPTSKMRRKQSITNGLLKGTDEERETQGTVEKDGENDGKVGGESEEQSSQMKVQRNTIEDVKNEMLGHLDGQLKSSPIIIDVNEESPAGLEGHSCVYVLEVGKGSTPPTFYVGETDSISRRILEHRSERGSHTNVRIAVAKVENKSQGMLVETMIIKHLKEKGFSVENKFYG